MSKLPNAGLTAYILKDLRKTLISEIKSTESTVSATLIMRCHIHICLKGILPPM